MYRRGQKSNSALLSVILIGVIVGLAFVLLDNSHSPAPSQPVPSAFPTSTFTALPLTLNLTITPEPQARLFIPTDGLNVMVVDTYVRGKSWDVAQLGDNAGHLQGTAWFGSPGNIALAGHVELADGSAGIFAGIGQLAKGDPVILSLGSREQRYAVTAVETVNPDDLSVVYPTTDDRITLITCDAYDFLEGRYKERVVVVAQRVT